MNRIAQFAKISQEKYIDTIVSSSIDEATAKRIYSNIKLPARATTGSAGYDFYAPYDITLAPGQTAKVPTGIRSKIDEGWVLMIFPRSGLGFKYRLQLDNTVGVIDSDYYFSDNEGHIMIKVTNCTTEGKTIEIKSGQGFAQGVFLPYGITVDDSADGIRNGGFGSTSAT